MTQKTRRAAKGALTALAATMAFAGPAQAEMIRFDFRSPGNIDNYTIPITGLYDIAAYGAQGGRSGLRRVGGPQGGKGAEAGGGFNLSKGEMLRLLVGGKGADGFIPRMGLGRGGGGGGGGGSFVVSRRGGELVIAGGGGGGDTGAVGLPGQAGSSGARGEGNNNNGGRGGTKGGGGNNGLVTGGGGGFKDKGNGRNSLGGSGGKSFANGGAGGKGSASGGGNGGFGDGGLGGGGGGSFAADLFASSPLATKPFTLSGGRADDGLITLELVESIDRLPEAGELGLMGLGLVLLAGGVAWRRRHLWG